MAYLIAAAIVAGMTVTPVPLPPSWLVLAFISLELEAEAAGVVVAGALGATAGRVGLVAWTGALGPRLLGSASRENLEYLSERLRRPRSWRGVAVLLAVSPPPAGALYTAAGLLRLDLRLVAASCFAGRLVSYGLGVALVGGAADEVADRLRGTVGPLSVGLGLAAVAGVLWLITRLDWRALLEERRPRLRGVGRRSAG